MHILIVENDAVTALDLEGLLIEAGYSVTGIAASANEALEMAKRDPPDLALLDIGIAGGVDGIELASRLQEDFSLAHVYLTGHIEPAFRIRANRTGPLGYVVKPFENAELLICIATALCRSGLHCRGASNLCAPAPLAMERPFPVFQPVRIAADVCSMELRCASSQVMAGRCRRDTRKTAESDAVAVAAP